MGTHPSVQACRPGVSLTLLLLPHPTSLLPTFHQCYWTAHLESNHFSSLFLSWSKPLFPSAWTFETTSFSCSFQHVQNDDVTPRAHLHWLFTSFRTEPGVLSQPQKFLGPAALCVFIFLISLSHLLSSGLLVPFLLLRVQPHKLSLQRLLSSLLFSHQEHFPQLPTAVPSCSCLYSNFISLEGLILPLFFSFP